MQRTRHSPARQQQQMRRHAASLDSYGFFNLLTGNDLFESIELLLPPHRERLFPPTETLSMFLAQALSTDRSCQRAVNEASVKRLVGGLPLCSPRTGGYCRARQRLPVRMIRELTRRSGQTVGKRLASAWSWHGRPVRLVDGTTVSMPDTEANQASWPQPHTQKPGLGFPQCRMVGLMGLGSGLVLNAALSKIRGKGSDEQSLLRSMLDTLEQGDVLLGDAYYPTFFLLAELMRRGMDGLFAQYGARKRTTDFRRGQRLGSRDHLITLTKPARRPEWMTQDAYNQVPATITVRELATGGKILVTTLLDARRVPKDELKQLYRRRWQVELGLRHLKTTLGIDQLSCKSPGMVEKEIWTYLLAYNLIRLSMSKAALAAGCSPCQLSFKHAVQLWLLYAQYVPRERQQAEDVRRTWMALMAQLRVGWRNGRIEPRALKRRPKAYPLLMNPRAMARAEISQYGHPQKLK